MSEGDGLQPKIKRNAKHIASDCFAFFPLLAVYGNPWLHLRVFVLYEAFELGKYQVWIKWLCDKLLSTELQ